MVETLSDTPRRTKSPEAKKAEETCLEKFIDHLEKRTNETLKELNASVDRYVKEYGEVSAEEIKDRNTVFVRQMINEKKLIKWQEVEQKCLRFERPDLREKLLAIAEVHNVGKNVRVLK